MRRKRLLLLIVTVIFVFMYLNYKNVEEPSEEISIYFQVKRLRSIHTRTSPSKSTTFSSYDFDLMYDINHYLKRPGDLLIPENFNAKYSQARQDEIVYNILQKNNGFFIEIGAFDGVSYSNTLWLEQKYNWTGLLIEANPELCSLIDDISRRAWRLCACISINKRATFVASSALGGLKETFDNDHLKSVLRKQEITKREITVPCFELISVLNIINVYTIDYLSLDVEGGELAFLQILKKYLKSDEIVVRVWTIEYRVFDGQEIVVEKSKMNLNKIRHFFLSVGGYIEHSQLDNIHPNHNVPDGLALDVVFIHVNSWCTMSRTLPNGMQCSKES